MTAAVPPKVVAGAAALALSSLLLLYRRRRRSAPTRAASPAAPAAPAPAKAPPRRETLTVELQDVCDVDLLTDAEASPEVSVAPFGLPDALPPFGGGEVCVGGSGSGHRPALLD